MRRCGIKLASALMRVIAATPADADGPTRLARQMSPKSFGLWPLRV